jgi:hypothetical protein
MRLLTTHEIGVLKGDLHDVVLPDSAELYVSTGLSQMFRRVSLEADSDTFENSWLYIPLDQVFSIRQNLIVAGRNPQHTYLGSDSVEIDDVTLYPILMKGMVRGIIANRSSRPLRLSGEVKEIMMGSLETYQENLEMSAVDSVEPFLQTLFRPESSFESFAHHFLNLLTQTCEGSCAGLYYSRDGVYTLRLVSGDLAKFDQLPGELKISTAQQWQAQMRQRHFFGPADLLPPHPAFLNAPPYFRFVHPGSKSALTEYLITMIVGADISYADLRRIEDLARFASSLSDSQFVRSGDILGLYGEFVGNTNKTISLEEILPELFALLTGQMSLSRLILVEGTRAGHVVRNKTGDDFEVEPISPDTIPEKVREALKKERFHCIQRASQEISDVALAKAFYMDNVKSEIYFALPGDFGGEMDILGIGAPVEGDYLCGLRDFLSRVAQFVRHYQRHRQNTRSGAVPATPAFEGERTATLRRLETVEKLSGGYFHDILSQMSVVCGQAEILAGDLRSNDCHVDTDDVLKGIERVLGAADLATECVYNLRDLSLLSGDKLSGDISATDLLKRLARVTHGYARHIRDTKNVVLEFESHSANLLDFNFTVLEVYDVVLPIILAIMEHAVCSGRLYFCLRCDGRHDSLVIRFDRSILPHIDLEDFLHKVFAPGLGGAQPGESGGISLGKTIVAGELSDKRMFELSISKAAEQPISQQTTNTHKVKKP